MHSEPVIGLEIHSPLNPKSKVLRACPVDSWG